MSGQSSYGELADVLTNLPMLCRENRRRRGQSLREAAAEMGVSFTALQRFERGGGGIHIDSAVAILRWIGGTDA